MPEWPSGISEEVRQHLDDQYRELRATGLSHDEAMRLMAEDVSAVRSTFAAFRPELLAADVRYALRTLRRQPAFTTVVLLTLALGIGANAAIFSVVNGVLLRPLPYRDADRLMVIWGDLRRPGLNDIPASAGEYVDYRDRAHSFEQVAAYDTAGFNLTGGEPERVEGAIVSTTFFSLLGASARIGRTFVTSEDQPGRDDVVVLSHALWTRRFSASPAIVGQTIAVDGRPAQVVGVMPAGFNFPDRTTEIWKPFLLDADALSDNNRGSHSYTALARLKTGISRAQAQADLDAVVATFKAEHPGNYRNGFGALLRPLQDEIVGDTGRPLLVLLGAVAVVLLIACANVANLLLARGASRRKEIAVRTALGASRGRLVRQLITESVLVSAIGGLIGLGLAAWGVDVLIAAAPDSLPRIHEVGVDIRVAVFTALVSLVTGLVFGIVPALRTSRAPLNDALKEGGRTGGAAMRGIAGPALVVSEVALSIVLLIGAGLLIHSFARLQDVAPGFDTNHLLTFRLSLPESRYTSFQKGQTFFDELFASLRRTPEVRSVAAINSLPFSGFGGSRTFFIEGREQKRPEDQTEEQLRIVTDRYFETMGIPIIAGREFTERDSLERPRVAVVNDALAKKHWPHESPIGRRVSFSTDEPSWYEIVGVVANIKHRALEGADRPELYVPYRQPIFSSWTVRPMYVVVRTLTEPAANVMAMRREIGHIDRDQPISDVRTMDERIDRSLSGRRFNMVLLALFAGLALTLAGVGIYGIVAYSVTERTHEIGVRVALGAQRRDVVVMVIRQGMAMTAMGTVVGIAAAAAAARLMSSLLFGVSAIDPATFLVIPSLLIGVAFLACYVPARRATWVDPLQTLRSE